MAEGIVLTVPNTHIPMSGKAPNLNASDFAYCSYFENDYGEQLVVVFDMERAWLYHGDIGWKEPLELVNGYPVGYILSDEEREWLNLCWTQIEKRKRWLERKGQ